MIFSNILYSSIKYKYAMWLQLFSLSFAEDIFRQDIGEQMEIGIAEKGYKKAQLNCGSDHMVVSLETEGDFLGVIYTRGSFYDKESPCFYDTGHKTGQRSFQLKFALNQCKTKQEGETYSNVLIVQHDKELIMPGDMAFSLECDYSKSMNVIVKADFLSKHPVTSRIMLTDADPSHKRNDRNGRFRVESNTNSVVISPNILRQRKEEL